MTTKKDKFLDHLSTLIRWKNLIITNVLIVGILSAIISLILPKWYISSAVIYPPKSSDLGLSSLLGDIPFSIGNMAGMDDDLARYLAILKSRSVKQQINYEFKIDSLYHKKFLDNAIKFIEDQTTIDITEEGLIAISYLDKDRDRATKIVQFYIDYLNQRNIDLKVDQAYRNRVFIEKRYYEIISTIDSLSQCLNKFQKESGVVEISEQASAAIAFVAELYKEKTQLEIQLEIARSSLTRNSDYITNMEKKYNAIINKINDQIDSTKSKDIPLPPISKIPDYSYKYVQYIRDLTIQEKILEFIAPQYEQAKIKEIENLPAVQIIDYPKTADLRAKPKRKLFVLSWVFFTLIVTIPYVYLKDSFFKKSQEDQERIRQLIHKLNPKIIFIEYVKGIKSKR